MGERLEDSVRMKALDAREIHHGGDLIPSSAHGGVGKVRVGNRGEANGGKGRYVRGGGWGIGTDDGVQTIVGRSGSSRHQPSGVHEHSFHCRVPSGVAPDEIGRASWKGRVEDS